LGLGLLLPRTLMLGFELSFGREAAPIFDLETAALFLFFSLGHSPQLPLETSISSAPTISGYRLFYFPARRAD
jgi:hypothetical protein